MVALTAGVVSALWAWLAPTSKIGRVLSDDPAGDDLKVHDAPIPPIGGIGIYLGLIPALFVVGDPLIALGVSAALALGVLDDRIALSPRSRLAAEVVIGLVVAVAPSIGGGPITRGVIGVGVVVLINAVNLFDGLDGLAGGSMVVAAAFAWIVTESTLALSLAAALLGFLLFNWHPASLFLGDGGAYLIATTFCAAVGLGDVGPVGVLALLGLSGVVVVDLLVTLIRRSRSGRPLFEGDRSHLYDQLVDHGWTVKRTASAAVVVQAGIGAVLTVAWSTGGPASALAAVAITVAGLTLAAWFGGFVSARPAG